MLDTITKILTYLYIYIFNIKYNKKINRNFMALIKLKWCAIY